MEIAYSSTEGAQSVTVTHEGTDYTATRQLSSDEGYKFEEPTQVPLPVRQAVREMHPEGIGTGPAVPSPPEHRQAEKADTKEKPAAASNAQNGGSA